ncbi:sel1 repeat family protein [Rhizobium sp. CFBP 8762]|nr:sel1 repeat family protein [Rhizobium sp. CFBP 8762]
MTRQTPNFSPPDVAEAQLLLGQLRLDRGDHPAALEWFRAAARGGSPAALNMIGRCYGMGWGVDADPSAAAEYYHAASTAGDTWALFNLADLFKRGFGVEKNETEAFRLYEKAASRGHIKSLNMLGLFYEDGRCVPRDLEQAAQYFRAGAEGGDCWAQFNYGRLLRSEGKNAAAKTWFCKALSTGFSDFHQAMGRLLSRQSDPELIMLGKQALARV